jgi:pimeloyl-ACP methyl ester carboxylesterase
VDIILIPGLWLDAASWSAVTGPLEAAGHRAHPLTLPGLESPEADRRGVALQDWVDAVVAAIDACPGDERVALVGHSFGCALAWAATDARPDRVAATILIGGFPTGDGDLTAEGFPARDGEVPLPDLTKTFSPEELAGLDDAALDRFRTRAIPVPEQVLLDPQRLVDERRYGVPVTLVCPEFTAEMVRGWLAQGAPPLRELPHIRDLRYVDLPTGHWPQFSRPAALAEVILAAIDS